jgi:lauroyl/myristoyl acyltransferase
MSVEAAPRPVEAVPPSVEPASSDALAYLTIRSAEWLGMRLPRRAGLALADLYFRAHYARAEGQRGVVAGNLARVLGHPADSPLVRSAVRECFRLYARYWFETFALRTMPADEVNKRFTIDGIDHVDRALAAGTGIVLTLPHMGNWDAAGHWLSLNGYRMTSVAEELRPKSVFDLFLRHRRALGIGIVPLSEGSRVAETLIRLLSENHIITLVADRDLTGRGVEVDMFGAKRLLPAGPAMLALATGAPLCVCAVFTTPEGWHTVIGPPVEIERSGVLRQDVTALTRLIAHGFERYIASAPADWHMFQPAWNDPA